MTIDPIFPPIEMSTSKKLYVNDILPEIKYELIFDEKIDCPFEKSYNIFI